MFRIEFNLFTNSASDYYESLPKQLRAFWCNDTKYKKNNYLNYKFSQLHGKILKKWKKQIERT